MKSTDFGKQRGSDVYWVVLATSSSITGEDSAKKACQQLFPGQSGKQLQNNCMPRRYDRPHS